MLSLYVEKFDTLRHPRNGLVGWMGRRQDSFDHREYVAFGTKVAKRSLLSVIESNLWARVGVN